MRMKGHTAVEKDEGPPALLSCFFYLYGFNQGKEVLGNLSKMAGEM